VKNLTRQDIDGVTFARIYDGKFVFKISTKDDSLRTTALYDGEITVFEDAEVGKYNMTSKLTGSARSYVQEEFKKHQETLTTYYLFAYPGCALFTALAVKDWEKVKYELDNEPFSTLIFKENVDSSSLVAEEVKEFGSYTILEKEAFEELEKLL